MKYNILKNSSGVILPIYLQNLNSFVGSGLTGVSYSGAGIKCYYKKNTDPSVTLVTLVSGIVGTYVANGLVEVSSANAPGDYELCLPNAAFAAPPSGNVFLTATLYNVINALPVKIDIQLTDPPSNTSGSTFDSTVTEPSAVPAFPSTINQAVAFILQRAMNKETCTDNTAIVYKSDGTTVVGTASITDDGTTLTRGAYS